MIKIDIKLNNKVIQTVDLDADILLNELNKQQYTKLISPNHSVCTEHFCYTPNGARTQIKYWLNPDCKKEFACMSRKLFLSEY